MIRMRGLVWFVENTRRKFRDSEIHNLGRQILFMFAVNQPGHTYMNPFATGLDIAHPIRYVSLAGCVCYLVYDMRYVSKV